MKTTDMTGIAVEKAEETRWGVYVNGALLRTPVRGAARWFRTQEQAIRAGLKARA